MEELNRLTVKKLQRRLKERGLPVYYKTKSDLVERLQEGIAKEVQDYLSATSKEVFKNKEDKQTSMAFTFRDVEESLEFFDGENGKDVNVWLKEFDDIADVCEWSDVQKYLYARRLLKGAAKLAVAAASNVKKWTELEEYLRKEFGEKSSSLDIHRTLERRKKKSDESYLEYLFAMKQIATKGGIDEKSLVTYIVDGIADEAGNKAILYDARSFDELKEKIRSYELVKDKKKRDDRVRSGPSSIQEKTQDRNIRCISCGGKGHQIKDCRNKDKGPRCFRCNEFGHISPNCPKLSVPSVSATDAIMHIKAKVDDLENRDLNGDGIPMGRKVEKCSRVVQRNESGEPSSLVSRVKKLEAEVERMKSDMMRLKSENEVLRHKLIVGDNAVKESFKRSEGLRKDVTPDKQRAKRVKRKASMKHKKELRRHPATEVTEDVQRRCQQGSKDKLRKRQSNKKQQRRNIELRRSKREVRQLSHKMEQSCLFLNKSAKSKTSRARTEWCQHILELVVIKLLSRIRDAVGKKQLSSIIGELDKEWKCKRRIRWKSSYGGV